MSIIIIIEIKQFFLACFRFSFVNLVSPMPLLTATIGSTPKPDPMPTPDWFYQHYSNLTGRTLAHLANHGDEIADEID